MKIMHFLNHAHKANGHVELAVDLACEQAAQGHRVVFLSGPGDFGDCLRRNGVEFIGFPEGSKLLRPLRMGWALMTACSRHVPDVVNAHMVAAALVARAVEPLFSYFLVTTVHNSFDRQSRLMGVGDRVIAVSDAVNEEMRGKGIRAEKLRTVRNGTIGGRRRAFMPQEEAELKHPAVATVAGLHGRKGVDIVIDAFLAASKSVPDAHLYIVGEGPSRPALERRADAAISSDWEAAAASVNLGGPISQHRPKSKIVKDISALVDRLVGGKRPSDRRSAWSRKAA